VLICAMIDIHTTIGTEDLKAAMGSSNIPERWSILIRGERVVVKFERKDAEI
jgi:hypothetical protein